MKFLVLLLVVIAAVAWFALGRRRSDSDGPSDDAQADKAKPPAADAAPVPQAMVACAHCGVHLPEADALHDADGRVFCSDAHRLAGPRSGG